MKREFQLESGLKATLQMHKMYASIYRVGPQGTKMDSAPQPRDAILPIDSASGQTIKNAFEFSLAHQLDTFMKKPGREAIGYCIFLDVEGNPMTFYGSSVKSEKDKWDGFMGRKVAYQELSLNIKNVYIYNPANFNKGTKQDLTTITEFLGIRK